MNATIAPYCLYVSSNGNSKQDHRPCGQVGLKLHHVNYGHGHSTQSLVMHSKPRISLYNAEGSLPRSPHLLRPYLTRPPTSNCNNLLQPTDLLGALLAMQQVHSIRPSGHLQWHHRGVFQHHWGIKGIPNDTAACIQSAPNLNF
jgi:hypothetical protein